MIGKEVQVVDSLVEKWRSLMDNDDNGSLEHFPETHSEKHGVRLFGWIPTRRV
jgi:hypothetical protein